MTDVSHFNCFHCNVCEIKPLCVRIAKSGAVIGCTEITDIVSEIIKKCIDEEEEK